MSTITKYDKILLFIFLLTLPLSNPWVRGDGVGYYAYARSLLIEHGLNFEKDWEHGNDSFRSGRLAADGNVLTDQYTSTGRIRNIWTIGPALLWLPFLGLTHAGVLVCDRFGAHIPADGFSSPYLLTMALSTAFYGFLAIWISFRLARSYFQEKWAFLAVLGIWGASSLPVYMYFNPSWSHAHSAFAVALFLWYWHRTRDRRTLAQWIILGLISGLMVDVYYPNGVLLLVPLIEAMVFYSRSWMAGTRAEQIPQILVRQIIYVAVFLIAMLPTFMSRYVIFGSALKTGYMPADTWNWKSPHLWGVLFSSDHGLLCWTPILILALGGLLLFLRTDRLLAGSLMAVFVSFYLVIAFYPNWDGISSFGNRFFVSLTALFVLGLAAAFAWIGHSRRYQNAAAFTATVTGLLIAWNLALVFQWGTHLIPARGPISWKQMVHNQFFVVPQKAAAGLVAYVENRRGLMQQIERQDLSQMNNQAEETSKPK